MAFIEDENGLAIFLTREQWRYLQELVLWDVDAIWSGDTDPDILTLAEEILHAIDKSNLGIE